MLISPSKYVRPGKFDIKLPSQGRRAPQDEVRSLAYRLYELNGRQGQHAEQDWHQAEQELLAWGRKV